MATKSSSELSDAATAEQTTAFLRNLHHFNRGIVRKLTPVIEREQGIDLRLYFILKHIEDGIVHPGAISQATQLPNSVITRHIDQLVQRRMLKRDLDPKDSRRIRLTLTEEGARAAREADESLSQILRTRIEGVPPERRKIFLSVLSELANALEK